MMRSKRAEMKNKRPLLLFFLLMGFLLSLGLLFQQFFLTHLILPVATVFWLLLRIFVLSIDQQIYWWMLISLVVFLAIHRISWGPETIEPYQDPGSNQTLDSVDHWRNSILSNVHETGENHMLKRELMWLLASMVSSRQKGSAHFEIKDALKAHQIPLPEHVYAFLFSNEPEESRQPFFHNPVRTFKQILQSIRRSTQKKIRRWTGREAAEYYQAIDEVLTLMESTLEIKYDDDPTGPRNE